MGWLSARCTSRSTRPSSPHTQSEVARPEHASSPVPYRRSVPILRSAPCTQSEGSRALVYFTPRTHSRTELGGKEEGVGTGVCGQGFPSPVPTSPYFTVHRSALSDRRW